MLDPKWNEWSMKVLQELSDQTSKLQHLEDNFDDLNKSVNERFDHIDKKVAAINLILTGNGVPEQGIIVQLDRLKEDSKRGEKFRWGIVAALLSLASAIAKVYITGK